MKKLLIALLATAPLFAMARIVNFDLIFENANQNPIILELDYNDIVPYLLDRDTGVPISKLIKYTVNPSEKQDIKLAVEIFDEDSRYRGFTDVGEIYLYPKLKFNDRTLYNLKIGLLNLTDDDQESYRAMVYAAIIPRDLYPMHDDGISIKCKFDTDELKPCGKDTFREGAITAEKHPTAITVYIKLEPV